jgi:hypothetical protein
VIREHLKASVAIVIADFIVVVDLRLVVRSVVRVVVVIVVSIVVVSTSKSDWDRKRLRAQCPIFFECISGRKRGRASRRSGPRVNLHARTRCATHC